MPPRGFYPIPERSALALLLTITLALPSTSMADAAAGRVNFAIGKVSRIDDRGRTQPVRRGTIINSGDTVRTERGRVQIRFNDGAFTSLKPDTEFRVDEYAFERKPNGRERSIFSLIRGGLRTITGLIGKRDRNAYQLRTRVATIGIRGTGFGAQDDGGSVNLNVLEGLVEMCNGGGCVVGAPGAVMAFVSDSQPGQVVGDSQNSNNTTDSEEDNSGLREGAEAFVIGNETDEEGGFQSLGGASGLPSGPGYALVLAFGDGELVESTFEFPLRTGDPVDAQFVGTGSALVSYAGPSQNVGSGSLGASVATEFGDDGIIGWGRWVGGTTTGTNPHPMTLGGGNFAMHYAVGKPTIDMPQSGTAAYDLIAGTTPTLLSGGNGTGNALTSANLNVDFQSATMMLNLGVTVNQQGQAHNYSVSNMPLNIQRVGGVNTHAFQGSGAHAVETNFGALCNGSSKCDVTVEGFFAGNGASRAGLGYTIDTRKSTGVSAGPNDEVIGTAAFKQVSSTAGTAGGGQTVSGPQ